MKKLILVNLIIFIFSLSALMAQVALNGTVEIFPYNGSQPDLISGTSSQHAVEEPLLRHVYLADKNIIALTIDEKAVIYRSIIPYEKQKGDTVILGDYHNLSKILVRDGAKIGYLCGVNNNWFRPFNKISGEALDIEWISNPENYSLVSAEDDNYKSALRPEKVFRKTVPHRRTHISQNEKFALRHEIYLVFEEELKPGSTYNFEFATGSPFEQPLSFRFNDSELRTEAIHVNLSGYHPNQPKTAFLSFWLGDGGAHQYKDVPAFHIINNLTNETVFTGDVVLKSSATEPEYSSGPEVHNHNLTDVYSLDFSDLKKKGDYRVFIPGIGCSFNFNITDKTWEELMQLTMKGFLHQRSGIALGPPHTDYLRPRNMHPEDEITIHKCDVGRFFGDSEDGGQSGVFERIQASILPDTEVPEAWGGWMDAGDFDQRMSHLFSVRRIIYLHKMNPEYYEKLNLNIPESQNGIPDILDEGRWCLDLYKRTQGVYDDGGISWWVESIEHPRGAEPSWLNSLPTALVPPTPRASYHYAATAALMADALKKYDEKLAEEYLKSAIKAVKWADENSDAPDPFGRNPREVTEALAFVSLYNSTGERLWHDRLMKALQKIYPDGLENNISTGNAEILANYLLLDESKADDEIRTQAAGAIAKLADNLLAGANENTYSVFKGENEQLRRMVLPPRSVLPVVMAHWTNPDKKYADALAKTLQYTLGANPMNRSYISGLGERWYIPYHHDWEGANMPVPSGIPNFGPIPQDESGWGWTGTWAADMIEGAGLYPNNLMNWPFVEKCFNNTWIAPVNEFTVRHPMGEILLLSGYLAQDLDN